MTQEALKLALEALEANDQLINGTGTNGGLAYCIDGYYSDCFDVDPINKQTEEAITAIKEALAQPEQEPVAWKLPDKNVVFWEDTKEVDEYHGFKPTIPLYTTPPQRTWVGLTEQERNDIEDYCEMMIGKPAFDAIEAKLKEKNGYTEEKNT